MTSTRYCQLSAPDGTPVLVNLTRHQLISERCLPKEVDPNLNDLEGTPYRIWVPAEPVTPARHQKVVASMAERELEPGVWEEIFTLVDLDPLELANSLQVRKAVLKNAVKAHGGTILLGGFPHDFGEGYGVLHLQLRDADDKANWLTAETEFRDAEEAGYGELPVGKLRTAEDVDVVVTPTNGRVILKALRQWGMSMFGKSWEKQNAIDAAADHAALDIIEPTIPDGWV